MNRHLLILALLLTLPLPAFARLGETEAALAQRYGKPSYKIHRAWGDEEGFSFNGFSIAVSLLNGVSAGEYYRLAPGEITVDQADQLLFANSEGYSWNEVSKTELPKRSYPPIIQMWRRPNGSTAVLTKSTMEFQSIWLIMAKEKPAQPVAPSTQGF